jgi:hypothetical protein
MSYVIIKIKTDIEGNFYSDVYVRARDILKTIKWYYQKKSRIVIKEIVKSFFEQEENKNYLKQFIEEELKKNYLDDKNIEIKKLDVCDIKFDNEIIIVSYLIKLSKKQNKNKTIILLSYNIDKEIEKFVIKSLNILKYKRLLTLKVYKP